MSLQCDNTLQTVATRRGKPTSSAASLDSCQRNLRRINRRMQERTYASDVGTVWAAVFNALDWLLMLLFSLINLIVSYLWFFRLYFAHPN